MTNLHFIPADIAFDDAVDAGYLSANPGSEVYAGNFMYMGTDHDDQGEEVHWFKHIDTREYLLTD